MHQLINARTGAERERIIDEARVFCEEQERRTRLEPPARLKAVSEADRPRLTRY